MEPDDEPIDYEIIDEDWDDDDDWNNYEDGGYLDDGFVEDEY